MPILEGWPEFLMDRIITQADETMEDARRTGIASPHWVVDRFAAAEVVFGAYPDEEGEAHVAVLRGIEKMMPVIKMQSDAPPAFYLRCWSRLDAEGYFFGFGDGRVKPGIPTIDDIPAVRMVFMNEMPEEERQEVLDAAMKDKAAAMAAREDREAWITEAFEADFVVGVWESTTFVSGIGVGLLKGAELMRSVIASGRRMVVSQVHILCANVGHAETLCREYGEGREPGSIKPVTKGRSSALRARATRYSVEILPMEQPPEYAHSMANPVAVLVSVPRPLNDDVARA